VNLREIFKRKKTEDAPNHAEDAPNPDSKHNVQAPVADLPMVDGKHNIQAPVTEAPTQAPEPGNKPTDPIDIDAVQLEIVKAFKTVYDPEIPVDIYELGLIYELKLEPDGNAYVKMTLTSPNCPVAGILPGQVESAARGVDGVYDVKLDLVFDPPWGPDRMSEAAKLELGML
jgi:FeS assembly SUF system protein